MLSRSSHALPFLLAMFLAGGACDGDRNATGGWQAVTDTVGDTIVVHTTAGSLRGSPRSLEPELRIGVVEGDDAYMFGSIRGLAVSDIGDIYVVDTQVPAIRRYGPDGTWIATIGRAGSGPGEYRQPDGGIAILADGRLLVRDPGNARINVYTLDGLDLGTWDLPSRDAFNTSGRLFTDTASNSYTLVLRDPAAAPAEWRFALARIRPDGTSTDSIAAPAFDYERSVISARVAGRTALNNVPFTASEYWTLSPFGYVVRGVSDAYRIELMRPEGVVRIERDYEPVPVDPAERAEAEERAMKNMRDLSPGWRWNGPPVPDTKAPFRNLFVGDDGRIWVLLSRTGVEAMSEAEALDEERRTGFRPGRFREPVVFDVFEPDGRYLGRVDAPEGFSVFPQPVFRGDRIWATVRDELDVAYVVRYRVDAGSDRD